MTTPKETTGRATDQEGFVAAEGEEQQAMRAASSRVRGVMESECSVVEIRTTERNEPAE